MSTSVLAMIQKPVPPHIEQRLPSEVSHNFSRVALTRPQKNPGNGWTPQSWTSKPAAQAVEYPDPLALEHACATLRTLPPLVSPLQIELAREQLRSVACGKAFIIQGGDCAESFHDLQYDLIRAKVELLSKQAHILASALSLPVIQIGRIAGQYAKPRSCPYEILPNGTKIVAFRGHNVNSEKIEERAPDPQRLLSGYFHSSATLNTIGQIRQEGTKTPEMMLTQSAQFHTSHEALHMPYESALTQGCYNTSASFIWLGERTRQLNGAHVEYTRGLRNPIGIKVGPTAEPSDIVALLDVLSPNRSDIGHVTLITRLGAQNVDATLPWLIRAVQASGHTPVWMCDPCHGNTVAGADGIKTRSVETMLEEVRRTWSTHRSMGSWLGGLHLEQTGENVGECVSGDGTVDGMTRQGEYTSLCDPRLSAAQALRFVGKVSECITRALLQEQEATAGLY
ncbi:MAG: hypothetical protein M1833_001216 [Piccolia ochrophora]|nr:MAG: hypothetical protein M1833_001216 [Piccolia ochrophora]